ALGGGLEEERAEARAGPASREEPRVVQERARRGAGRAARRPHARRDQRARRRAHANARRAVRKWACHRCRRGGWVERGGVSCRRARDVPGPGPALPSALKPPPTGLPVAAARGVIFDMDGVLIDSGAHHREAWRALLDELGVAPAQPDYWRLTIGRPGNEAVPLLLGRPLSWAEAMRLADRKRDHYVRLGPPGLPTVRGVPAFPDQV